MNKRTAYAAAGFAMVSTIAIVFGSSAYADPSVGPYVKLSGGATIMPDTNIKGYPGFGPTLETDTGFAAAPAIGWSFGNGLRAELEGQFRYSDINKAGGYGSKGFIKDEAGFGNLIYDFDSFEEMYGSPIIPHIGVGVGFDDLQVRGVADRPGYVNPGHVDVVFTYQGILGVDYAISDRVKLGVDYRFVGTDEQRFSYPDGSRVHYPTYSNVILASLRYDLGDVPQPSAPPAPPPPPPPPPPPAAPAPVVEPGREYQVFFNFDKSNILPDAAHVIQEAADNIKAGHITTINVTGHTDTVGSARYNQKLSERRAASVKKQLIEDGVTADEIRTEGVGKTDLLVPTPDQVREPQNRRAVIKLQ